MSEEKKCKQILSDGSQCNAWVLTDKQFCFSHDPQSREAKLEAVRKGGSAKEVELEYPLQLIHISNPRDAVYLLARTIDEVRSGELDPRIANTIGYLAGHLIRAFEVAEVNEKAEQAKGLIAQMIKDRAVKRSRYDR
jgi:hypothetical protein